MIGDVRFAGERDGDDLDGLVVVKRLEDEAWRSSTSIAVRPVGGGLSGTVGQVVS